MAGHPQMCYQAEDAHTIWGILDSSFASVLRVYVIVQWPIAQSKLTDDGRMQVAI